MIGLGNAFRLPGLQKYLQEKLQLEVRKFTKLARVEGEEVTSAPTFIENLPSFAVAYGLALQGLNTTRLTTNLLPYEVHMERLVRGKKPWAVTAAACLLLAVAGLTFARAVEQALVTGPGNRPTRCREIDKTIADRKNSRRTTKRPMQELERHRERHQGTGGAASMNAGTGSSCISTSTWPCRSPTAPA